MKENILGMARSVSLGHRMRVRKGGHEGRYALKYKLSQIVKGLHYMVGARLHSVH